MTFLKKKIYILTIISVLLIITVIICHEEIFKIAEKSIDFFGSKKDIENFVKEQGIYAPIYMIAIQILQVILSPIPGSVITMISGALFGTIYGFLYSQIGQIIGSIMAFYISRLLLRNFIYKKISKKRLEKFTKVNSGKALIVVFFFYSIPWFPNDLMSYALGLSPVRFLPWLFVMSIGRIPNTLIVTLQGVGIWENDWITVLFLIILAGIIMLVSYLFRDKLDNWINSNNKLSIDSGDKNGS